MGIGLLVALPLQAAGQVRASELQETVVALSRVAESVPPILKPPGLTPAVTWLINNVEKSDPSAVSQEYLESLRRAAELLKGSRDQRLILDVTSELEAKVEHCRVLGVGMGGSCTDPRQHPASCAVRGRLAGAVFVEDLRTHRRGHTIDVSQAQHADRNACGTRSLLGVGTRPGDRSHHRACARPRGRTTGARGRSRRSMSVAWPYAVAAGVAASAALLSPLTSAIPAEDAWPLRLAVAAIGTFICLAVAVSRGVRPAIWTSLAIGAALLGVALLLLHVDARTQCLAEYDGRVVVIGRQYLPEMTAYVANNPGLSAADRLFDAGGVPERIWTAASIRTCTRLVGVAGLAAIPCITLAATALVSRYRHRFLPSPLPPVAAPARHHAGAAVQPHMHARFSATGIPSRTKPTRWKCSTFSRIAGCAWPSIFATSRRTNISCLKWSDASRRVGSSCASSPRTIAERSHIRRSDRLQDARHGRTPQAAGAPDFPARRPSCLAARAGRNRFHTVSNGRPVRAPRVICSTCRGHRDSSPFVEPSRQP